MVKIATAQYNVAAVETPVKHYEALLGRLRQIAVKYKFVFALSLVQQFNADNLCGDSGWAVVPVPQFYFVAFCVVVNIRHV